MAAYISGQLSVFKVFHVVMTFFAIFVSPLVVLNFVFIIEVMCGLLSFQTKRRHDAGGINAVVIVPAHNECLIIGSTLTKLLAAATKTTDILVVADNCSDSTAEVVRGFGARVTERFDEARRGKGFALAHARDELRGNPPDCVVVLDADCRIDRHSLSALIHQSFETGRPVQAINLIEADRSARALVQISNFAFFMKNSVRQRGLQRLAARVHLTGTGMAFPWHVYAVAPLATASIVEDLQLGLDLAEGGVFPMLVPEATIWSVAASENETMVQRRRWEGGFLRTAIRAAPRALKHALLRRDRRDVWAALDLFVPPVALLVLINLFILIVAVTLLLLTSSVYLPLMAVLASFGGVAAVVILAWGKEGKPFVSAKALLTAPVYAIRKLALYVGLVRSGAPSEWRRTERDPH